MIRYALDTAFLEDDFENSTTSIEGKILQGDEEEAEAGAIKAVYVDIETAMEAGGPLSDLFESDTQLNNYYDALHDKKSPLYNYLLKKKDWLLKEACGNLFFINRVWVHDVYRGKKLGLAAIYRTIQKFSHGCRLVVLEAVPLQLITKEPDERVNMGLNSLEQDEKKATNSLKAHYKKLGFEMIPHSNYMILDLELRRPNLKDIGFEDF